MTARRGRRTAWLGAALAALAAALPASGVAQRARTTARPAQAARAREANPEDDRYYQRAVALRRRLLDHARWAELDTAQCNAGSLRIFTRDTVRGIDPPADLAALERIIIVRGVENSLDTPAAHALLRTVIGWEVGVTRPVWDVKPGAAPRRAIAPGLADDVANPETGKCDSPPRPDTAIVVLPSGTAFEPPRVAGTVVRVVVAEEGLNRLRDAFFAQHGADTSSVLTYTRISAAVVWRNFAVVAVNRRAEGRGVVSLPNAGGGAAYIFHRIGADWRLLTITRTWG